MERLKNYLFNKRLKRHKARSSFEHRFVTYNKADSILLLFDFNSTKYDLYVEIINTLEESGKKVYAWAYSSGEKNLNRFLYPKLTIFDKKSLSITGKPLFVEDKKHSDQIFDLIIDLSLTPILPLMYIVLYTNAYCKAGTKKSKYVIFDFMIDIGDKTSEINEKTAFEQIIFYLKSIQTTD